MSNKKPNTVMDGGLHIRIEQKELDIFIKKSERITGRPYQMLIREMVTAFNSDKLRIKPTEPHHSGILYRKF